MRLHGITLAAMLGMATQLHAQTFLQHVQQKNSGNAAVTVTESSDIDRLVNDADVSGHKQATPAKAATATAKPGTAATTPHNSKPATGAAGNTRKEEHPAKENSNSARHDATARHDAPAKADSNKTAGAATAEPAETPAVDMSKKMPRRSYKVNGYRVQVFAGGNSRADKLKAQKAGNDVKMAYPEQPVYVHFYSPRWICRVGNFRSYEEASTVLRHVQKMGYKQACIVSGKITVAY